MKIAMVTVAIVFLIIAVLFLYTWYSFHTKINFHAYDSKPLPEGWKTETEYVKNSDGQRIAYWYFPADNPKAIVILMHGYHKTGGKSQMIGHAKYLKEAGYSTALLDLRSFGESDGNKITLGINEWKDVEAVYNEIKSIPENQTKKIGFLGESMGAVTAIMTTGITNKGDFVIASVPYADFRSMFEFQLKSMGLPSAIFYPLLKTAAKIELGATYEQFTPSKVISKIKAPILLISAKNDQEVDSQDAKILFDLANEPKQYWQSQSGHDIFEQNPEEFKQQLLLFLDQHNSNY